jgi:hypothetical protein
MMKGCAPKLCPEAARYGDQLTWKRLRIRPGRAMGRASPLSPSLSYNGRTTTVLGALRVKGDPATAVMDVGVMVKTYSLLVAWLVA